RGGRPDARSVHGRLPAQVAVGLVHVLPRLALELDLQGRHPGQGPALVREERHGHRALPLRGARSRVALGREEEPQLLGQGQALPRRLPRDLHQGLGAPGGGGPRRAGDDPVPRLLTLGARHAGPGPRPQGARPGEPLELLDPGRDQSREEALRRQAGAAGPPPPPRPLPGLSGPLPDRHRQGGGWRPAPRPAPRPPPRPAEPEKLPGSPHDTQKPRPEPRRLPRGAGAPDGFSFVYKNRGVPMPYEPVGVWLIDQWRQIGLNVRQDVVEAAKIYPTL